MKGEKIRMSPGPEDFSIEVEKFFTHLGRWKRPVVFFEKSWRPHCDVYETSDEIVVLAEISGVSVDDVEIILDGNHLVLRGIRKEQVSSHRENYHRMEINFGPFERVLVLPALADADGACATYDDGFLEVRLPKVEKGKPPETAIHITWGETTCEE